MNAADVMVHPVITIGPDATVHDAAALMVANHISAVPVIDAGGKLRGIISEAICSGAPKPEPSGGARGGLP
jgi:CBS domain-containing protein